MELTKIIAKTLLPRLERPKPENIILGEKDHPRKVRGSFPVPDFIQRLEQRHHMPELCFCLKGKLVMRMGEFFYRLKSGDLCVIGRNVTHYESFVTLNTSYETIWLFFASVNEVIMMHSRYKNKIFESVASIHISVAGDFIRQFNNLAENRHTWSNVRITLQHLGVIIREKTEKPMETYDITGRQARGYLWTRLQKALQYITDNCREDIHLKDVAEYVGLNPDYLERELHRIMGTTFLRHLTRSRLQRALPLFNDTNKTIAEIAYASGFKDPFDFSRVFKKHYGLSPRLFRDKYSSRPSF